MLPIGHRTNTKSDYDGLWMNQSPRARYQKSLRQNKLNLVNVWIIFIWPSIMWVSLLQSLIVTQHRFERWARINLRELHVEGRPTIRYVVADAEIMILKVYLNHSDDLFPKKSSMKIGMSSVNHHSQQIDKNLATRSIARNIAKTFIQKRTDENNEFERGRRRTNWRTRIIYQINFSNIYFQYIF